MNLHQHFGLSGPPFEMVDQPTSLYMSKAHREEPCRVGVGFDA